MKTVKYACNTEGNAKAFSAQFYYFFFEECIYQNSSFLHKRENSQLSTQFVSRSFKEAWNWTCIVSFLNTKIS